MTTMVMVTAVVMMTKNLMSVLIDPNERDISLDFLAQLGGDELQEILKEAGISNAVHRYINQLQCTG